MRFIPEVDIPNELLEAQNRDKLVVFAGAGVSVPSGLPKFEKFAEDAGTKFQISRLVDEATKKSKEPIDRFLGRLADKGLDIHKYAAEVYSDESKTPNDLHLLSLRLFQKDAEPRLVTTNYDTLFALAAKQLNRTIGSTYYAPALPPGDKCAGIVHVHGCVSKPAVDLVLTDQDFGRAYLTEGWARRFLVGVFRTHTVLFLGYSHDDPLLGYLARGLPADNPPRFAFSMSSDAAKWEFLGIRPIQCEAATKQDFHTQENDTLVEWVRFFESDLLSMGQRLKNAAKSPDLLDSGTRDLVLHALADLPKLRLFLKHADNADWLPWLDEQVILKSLFDPECKLTEPETELAEWISDQFVVSASEEVFELYHKNGQRLNPEFWRKIVRQLTYADKRPDPVVLKRWVILLLRDVPTDAYRYYSLDYLLTKCRLPDDQEIALFLLDYLLTPVPVIEPSWGPSFGDSGNRKIAIKLTLRGDSYWLDQSWTKLFKPHIKELWSMLGPMAVAHLMRAYQMNLALGRASEDQDAESTWRSAIEPHQQDEYRRSLDMLIDVARDVLETAIAEDSVTGERLVNAWYDSGVPLLKRIAIHGLGELT